MSVEMSVKVPVEMSVEVPVETPVTIFIAEVTELKEPERKRFFSVKVLMASGSKRAAGIPNYFSGKKKKQMFYRKKLVAWQLEVTKVIFCMMNKEDARDGILSHQRMDEDDARRRRRDTEI